MRRSRSGPISVQEEESKRKQNIVAAADNEEEAYMAKASGMGQTKGLAFISAEEENKQENRRSLPNEKSKLLLLNNQQQQVRSPGNQGTIESDQSGNVDFFNDRDYYKIFLETSKEQERRVKNNSPFAALKTWRLLRVIVKTNDDLR